MEKTNLQIQIENACKLIARKIEEAVENGATIERPFNGAAIIDGVIITLDLAGEPKICLNIGSPIIQSLFEPDEETLLKERDKLTKQLEEINSKLATK